MLFLKEDSRNKFTQQDHCNDKCDCDDDQCKECPHGFPILISLYFCTIDTESGGKSHDERNKTNLNDHQDHIGHNTSPLSILYLTNGSGIFGFM